MVPRLLHYIVYLFMPLAVLKKINTTLSLEALADFVMQNTSNMFKDVLQLCRHINFVENCIIYSTAYTLGRIEVYQDGKQN